MGDARRSLIVMLPADLVDRLDARAAEAGSRGRDDLIAEAVDSWLREAPVPTRTAAPRMPKPADVEVIVERVQEDIERLATSVREASARRGRAIDELAAQLRGAAEARDRDGFIALGDRLVAVQELLRGGVQEALAELSALVQQAAGLFASSLPALPDDARSRWLSAQAGRGLAPDRVVRGASAIERAVTVQQSLREAATRAAGSVTESRASIERHADPHAVAAAELRLDDDVDLETWSWAARVAAANISTELSTQRAVLEVGLDHAIAVARASLDMVGTWARELAEILADVPDVASAC